MSLLPRTTLHSDSEQMQLQKQCTPLELKPHVCVIKEPAEFHA
jgi:hypothetical protein